MTDLIFATKIRSTAEALGADVHLARNATQLFEALGEADPLVIVDLDLDGEDPVHIIEKLRARRPATRILAFVSHVRTELAAAAQQAGADQVWPRSQFTAELPQILGGPHAP